MLICKTGLSRVPIPSGICQDKRICCMQGAWHSGTISCYYCAPPCRSEGLVSCLTKKTGAITALIFWQPFLHRSDPPISVILLRERAVKNPSTWALGSPCPDPTRSYSINHPLSCTINFPLFHLNFFSKTQKKLQQKLAALKGQSRQELGDVEPKG